MSSSSIPRKRPRPSWRASCKDSGSWRAAEITTIASSCRTMSRISVAWARCSWERNSSRWKSSRCKLLQLDSSTRNHRITTAVEECAGIYVRPAVRQLIHDRPMGVRHDHETDVRPPAQEVGGPAPLRGRCAVEHGTILRVVREVPREKIGDPESNRRMQHAKHRDGHGMPREAVHQRAGPVLLGPSVAVHHERAAPAEVQLRFAAEKLDAQVLAKEAATPAVVVAAHERDGNAPCPNGLQFRDGREMFARDHGVVLEPKVEQVAREDQVIPRLRDLIEERVKGGADGRRHLTEVGVCDHDHTCWGQGAGGSGG